MNNEKIELGELKIEEIEFDKMNGLIPTIIQGTNGTILSLIYSNKESLEKSIQTGKVWSYSRSRKGVFQKGASSGNEQKIVEIKLDCDNDSILFKVNQKGNCACHTGKYSCFGEGANFDLNALYDKIALRIKSAPENSYTKKLLLDEALLKRKLIEEAAEVITFKDRENLIWECSDLIYFLFVIMAKEGVTILDVENENERRNK